MQSIFVKKIFWRSCFASHISPWKSWHFEPLSNWKSWLSDAKSLGELTLEDAFSPEKLTLDTLPEGSPRLWLITRYLYFSQLPSWPPSQQLGWHGISSAILWAALHVFLPRQANSSQEMPLVRRFFAYFVGRFAHMRASAGANTYILSRWSECQQQQTLSQIYAGFNTDLYHQFKQHHRHRDIEWVLFMTSNGSTSLTNLHETNENLRTFTSHSRTFTFKS